MGDLNLRVFGVHRVRSQIKRFLLRTHVAGIFLLSVGTLTPPASALEAYGFVQGMSPSQVELAASNLGIAKWFGKTLIVQVQDAQRHSYTFNFCDEQLYEVAQTFPSNFDQMAGFVDQTLRQYGQPIGLSAMGGMGSAGFVRPINFYWKIGEKDYLRLMQLESSYALIYASKNACKDVPN